MRSCGRVVRIISQLNHSENGKHENVAVIMVVCNFFCL